RSRSCQKTRLQRSHPPNRRRETRPERQEETSGAAIRSRKNAGLVIQMPGLVGALREEERKLLGSTSGKASHPVATRGYPGLTCQWSGRPTAHAFSSIPGVFSCGPPLTGSVGRLTLEVTAGANGETRRR